MNELKLPNMENIVKSDDLSPEDIDELQNPLEEMESQQEINETLVNIPEEFEVGGKVIKVSSKSAREMVKIDKSIMKLLKLQFNRESIQIEDNENFWDDLEKIQDDYYNTTFEVLFLIINSNLDSPEYTMDWIMDNIDLSDGGVGEKILDAYNAKCSSQGFFQKVLRSRKF